MKEHVMDQVMDKVWTTVPTPQWMLDLFKAIDALDTSDTTGYQNYFAEDVDAAFGTRVINGREAVKKFLIELDQPFDTKHLVTAIQQVDNCLVVLCSADLTPKGVPGAKTTHVAPLVDIFWLDAKGKIARWVVTMPKGIEKGAVGVFS
jgi:hypothetical protein